MPAQVPTTVTLIAAVAENGVIGRDGDMPWRLPDDLARFKRLTMGKPLIVGRRTYASIGRPLPGRTMIVLSRTGADFGENVLVAASLTDAMGLVRMAKEVVIAGGAEVYAAAMPLATKMHLTRVHAEPEGDVRFPKHDPEQWRVVSSTHHPADDRHAYAMTFLDLQRVKPAG